MVFNAEREPMLLLRRELGRGGGAGFGVGESEVKLPISKANVASKSVGRRRRRLTMRESLLKPEDFH
jgi:hypothetical protein